MIVPMFRLGFGFDIEHNDTICHVVSDDDDTNTKLAAYEGLIIKLPFVAIYIGEFSDFDKRLLD